MSEALTLTIYGEPRSKKNSMQIIQVGGHPRIVQNKRYLDYERDAVRQIAEAHKAYHIDYRCNLKCIFYRSTHRRVDKSNLHSACDDILVKAGVIEDDNWKIVAGHDGSRIRFDKAAPRTEITITPLGEDE